MAFGSLSNARVHNSITVIVLVSTDLLFHREREVLNSMFECAAAVFLYYSYEYLFSLPFQMSILFRCICDFGIKFYCLL